MFPVYTDGRQIVDLANGFGAAMADPQRTGFSSSGPDWRCLTDCLGRLGIPTFLAGMLGV